MTKRYHLTLVLFAFLNPACGFAQQTANSYEPANFPADQSSIVARIEFPDYSKEVMVRVFCDVAVNKAGEFEKSIWWSTLKTAGQECAAALSPRSNTAFSFSLHIQ